MAFKPTSSILTPRRSIDEAGEEIELRTKGRHDPCVGIRAAPVVEAMIACVLADAFLRHRGQTGRTEPRTRRARIAAARSCIDDRRAHCLMPGFSVDRRYRALPNGEDRHALCARFGRSPTSASRRSLNRPFGGHALRFELLKILLVDDNHHMRVLLSEILRAIGVRDVFEATDGAEGAADACAPTRSTSS